MQPHLDNYYFFHMINNHDLKFCEDHVHYLFPFTIKTDSLVSDADADLQQRGIINS